MNEEEHELIELPVVIEVIISKPGLVYSSEQNKFMSAITIVLLCSDGKEYRYAIDPKLANAVFRIET